MTQKTIRKAPFAVRAGLGMLLGMGLALQPTAAVADQATLTIKQRHNGEAAYDAYLLFLADVDEHDQASHVVWASDATKDKLLAFLDAHGYQEWLSQNHPGTSQHDRAQNAAEYLALMIEDAPTDSGAGGDPRTTSAGSFANDLAHTLASSALVPEHATADEPFVGEEGYWLFVTTDATTQDYGEAGTAPILIPLGGSVTTMYEKSSVPTIDKEVYEDSTKTWGKVADANVTQSVPYRLSGTLPANYGTFDHYHYKFTDTLSEGLDLEESGDARNPLGLTVRIGDKAVEVDGTNLTATYEGRTLTVEFADLKAPYWDDCAITKDTVITVDYQAHLNTSCLLGSPGNPNAVYLTYTDDPVSEGDGRTEEVPVKVFSYKLRLVKNDAQTGEVLSGAVFTIQVAEGNADEASRGKYVQADGSLSDEPYRFVTDGQGAVEVAGLDEGLYRIAEQEAPEGFNIVEPTFDLHIDSSLDHGERTLVTLEATVSAPDGQASSAAGVSTIDGSAGTVTVTAANDRVFVVPLTGLDGRDLRSYVAVASLGSASLGLWFHRSSRQRLF